jgi:hypothetical protein
MCRSAQAAGAVRADLTASDLVALLRALIQIGRDADLDRLHRLRTVVLAGARPLSPEERAWPAGPGASSAARHGTAQLSTTSTCRACAAFISRSSNEARRAC